MTYRKRAKKGWNSDKDISNKNEFERREAYTELQIIEEVMGEFTSHRYGKKSKKLPEKVRLLEKLKNTRKCLSTCNELFTSFPDFVSVHTDKLVEEENIILEKLSTLGWSEEQ